MYDMPGGGSGTGLNDGPLAHAETATHVATVMSLTGPDFTARDWAALLARPSTALSNRDSIKPLKNVSSHSQA